MIGTPISPDSLFPSPLSLPQRALSQFLGALCRVLDLSIVRTQVTSSVPPSLRSVAQNLTDAGILLQLYEVPQFTDEPPFPFVHAHYGDKQPAGGASPTSLLQAYTAALAESAERFIWRHEHDFFRRPIIASENELRRKNPISLSRFAGFTEEQRRDTALQVTPETKLLWTQAWSFTEKAWRYIPAQSVSASKKEVGHEPRVVPRLTTGLATHVTRIRALISGALEIIERDAFMIMWLNQLSCPTFNLEKAAALSPELRTLLSAAQQYGLTVSVARLATDAPATVACAVVEDASDVGPRVTLGLGVHQKPVEAITHALLEALRIRVSIRRALRPTTDVGSIRKEDIYHGEHVVYWLHKERYLQLRFITENKTEASLDDAWENESEEIYWNRLVSWCTERNYDVLSVDLGISRKNVTPWHIQYVVIPQMQPMHLIEKYPCIGGTRLSEVPALCGFTPRTSVYTDEPHPFV